MTTHPNREKLERLRPRVQPPITSVRDVEALLLHDPEQYTRLLHAYDETLGSHVVDALDAIHRAESEQRVPAAALEASSVRALFAIVTLPKVVRERQRLDRLRNEHNRRAALLWAWSLDGELTA